MDGTMALMIVDDEVDTLDELLEFFAEQGYRCFGAASAEEALALFEREPDIGVVIADLRLPGADGNALVARLRQRHGHRRAFEAILVSAHAERGDVVEAMRSGVGDFHGKPLVPDALEAAVRRALARALEAAERHAFAGRVEAQLATVTHRLEQLSSAFDGLRERIDARSDDAPAAAGDAALPALTPRMWEVLVHIRRGKTNYQIACDLGLSENTVKLYVSQILQITRVGNRTQLALLADPWLRRAGTLELLKSAAGE